MLHIKAVGLALGTWEHPIDIHVWQASGEWSDQGVKRSRCILRYEDMQV